ncbi:MAG: hypothetical protein IPO13_01530 [Rhodocyclaceae bacterium]|nr:hypothetical protein [Rhodocyclaceae bacterium]
MKAAVATLPGAAERQAVATYIAAMPRVGAGDTASGKADLNNGKTQYNSLLYLLSSGQWRRQQVSRCAETDGYRSGIPGATVV